MRKRKRAVFAGISLVEILVTMGLLSLIMLLLVQIMIPGFRIWNRARVVADLEQQAMISEDRIVRAISSTIGSSIRSTYVPPAAPPTLHAVSMMGHGGTYNVSGYNSVTGAPEWTRVELFYVRPADGVLYQASWDGTSPSLPYDFDEAPFRLSVAHLTSLAGNPGQAPRRLAGGVGKLSLVGKDDSTAVTGEGFVLGLSMQVTVQNRKEPVKVERQVYVVPRLRERV